MTNVRALAACLDSLPSHGDSGHGGFIVPDAFFHLQPDFPDWFSFSLEPSFLLLLWLLCHHHQIHPHPKIPPLVISPQTIVQSTPSLAEYFHKISISLSENLM